MLLIKSRSHSYGEAIGIIGIGEGAGGHGENRG